MSVATPLVHTPAEPFENRPVRRLYAVPDPAVVAPEPREVLGSVIQLLPPRPEVPPTRLTRRGVVVVALLVAALGAALVWVAALSAPSSPASSGGSAAHAVTVRSGDTLWSIAGRVAPGRDPRAEVAALRQRNDLDDDVALQPGQVIRVP